MALSTLLFKPFRTLRGSFKSRICFLHVPKCGGTSVAQAIRRLYSASAVREIDGEASVIGSHMTGTTLKQMTDHLLCYHASLTHCSYIHGHFWFHPQVLEVKGPRWHYVTLLRDPVERWFSQYFFKRFAKQNVYQVDADLNQFIESDRAQSWGRMYASYYAGVWDWNESHAEAIISTAIENLAKFSVVGTLSDLACFTTQFRMQFGMSITIPWSNRNPVTAQEQMRHITPEIRDRVIHICTPDRIIYSHMEAMTTQPH